MIWIKPAQPRNLHDFLAARRLKNTVSPAVRWKEHFFWWWHGGFMEFFFLCSNRHRIGYVRVNHLGTVSIMVEETYRGRGYGLDLLRHLRWTVRGTLLAYVKPENTSSIALFRSAGYIESLIRPNENYKVLVSYD